MSLKYFISVVMSLALLTITASALTRGAVQIYSGKPLDDALSDLVEKAKLISHELSSASPLRRTDVFRLTDGRLLAITSCAEKLGRPYAIKSLRITPTAASKLTKRLPSLSLVNVPE